MNPLDTRKRLADFARQMRSGKPLQRKQRAFLAEAFERMANGEDATIVFGLKYQGGQSKRDAEVRQKWSFILHWIAGATEPVPGSITLEQAFSDAVPMAQKLFNDPTSTRYDLDYIRQRWYKLDYSHMRSVERGIFDPDSPYEIPPSNTKPRV